MPVRLDRPGEASMTIMRSCRSMLLAQLWTLSLCGVAAAQCPAEFAGARRLIVVAQSGATFKATVQAFERADDGETFKATTPPAAAVIGRNGLASGPNETVATDRLASKTEGDGRTPSGIYRIGRPFGFAASDRPGFLHLQAGKTFCVDQPSSRAYGQIVARSSVAPGTSGEDMRTIPLYRHGFVVDYPSNPATRSGSCIFFHIWRSPATGTAGCVATDERTLLRLQAWAGSEETRIVIADASRAAELSSCLVSK